MTVGWLLPYFRTWIELLEAGMEEGRLEERERERDRESKSECFYEKLSLATDLQII